ncbi:Oidioi.mRNA.OKI2018_I69.PAR.g9255.t1.cds [Oikopleura dioica]|uniref:Oidioi.mRNA.OKI2018_I69.PAR.g9255.t1.cds n=1 Tax=Oikopleura dioica TaxID=34765 RepID=A0ABN7RNZ3_OIKDI|nr:Oidioi.mRNA.OKI2018_I69.PAR.g9255.t1.cds [Oikopleura dioica]
MSGCERECLNNGLCEGPFHGRYMCNCATGYTGDTCQLVSWDHHEVPLWFTKEMNERNDVLEAENDLLTGLCIFMGFGFMIMICVSIFVYRRYQAAAVSYHHQENAIIRNFSKSSMENSEHETVFIPSAKTAGTD